MLIPDVSVLVGAYRNDAGRHEELKDWLENANRWSRCEGPPAYRAFARERRTGIFSPAYAAAPTHVETLLQMPRMRPRPLKPEPRGSPWIVISPGLKDLGGIVHCQRRANRPFPVRLHW